MTAVEAHIEAKDHEGKVIPLARAAQREERLDGERAIASGLVAGDRAALGAAFERWADLVHGVARQLVGRHDADDVVQQVFVAAWQSRQGFDPARGEVPGWLVGITRNVARTHVRRRGPVHLELSDELDDDPMTPEQEHVVDALLVASTIRDLPGEQRKVLELTLFHELTQAEAAERLGVPLGTVKTRQRRGLHTIRTTLGRTS